MALMAPVLEATSVFKRAVVEGRMKKPRNMYHEDRQRDRQ